MSAPSVKGETANEPLLRVVGLEAGFRRGAQTIKAVDGVDFDLIRGETFCIVGESGSGKSVTALSLMGLLGASGRVAAQAMRFEGVELTTLDEAKRRDLRGNRMSMIFQEPLTSLNPALSIGDQVAESLIRHRSFSRADALTRAAELLSLVRIADAGRRLNEYPHQLSGGMRQRVMIAMALACEPSLLIADEPTTALDVTIQAQIMDLIGTLRDETGAAILLITHDLGIVAESADRVVVMYAGKIVESGDVEAIFDDPQHPYTLGLMSSIPSLNAYQSRLHTIEGMVPTPAQMPAGCRFHPRCPLSDERCASQPPPMREFGPGHFAACWRAPVEQNG